VTIVSMALKVLVVDDHRGFRSSARTLLELEGFEVVAEAPDGASAIRLAEKLRPDLVLLDIGLPDMSGFDVAERIEKTKVRVILTSSREPRDFGGRIDRSGVLGFVSKDDLSGAAVRELLGAVR
jgi:DNA-binding NarL/FixJ family response regulator